MAQFVRRSSDETAHGDPIRRALGSSKDCPEVRNAFMATTTVEWWRREGEAAIWGIGAILSRPDDAQEEEQEEEQEGDEEEEQLVSHILHAYNAASGLCCRGFDRWALQEVSIPNSATELCDYCFMGCMNLWRVTFGCSSSLERIGVSCFEKTRVLEVSIPSSVRELDDGCFKWCQRLRRVTFGCLSHLRRIGVSCFECVAIKEVSIPDSVRELCDGCFKGCKSLVRVTFGSSPCLERIGAKAFGQTFMDYAFMVCGLVEICIPDSVRELGDGCFKGCKSLVRVTFGSSSCLERIGVKAFGAVFFDLDLITCRLVEICIPDSVRELCDGCFKGCKSLVRVSFGSSSCLERIGAEAFAAMSMVIDLLTCGLAEIHIPDSVRELGDGCFKGCKSLVRVTFGSSSCLERIGAEAFGVFSIADGFATCGLVEIHIPDSVCELCDGCFKGCKSLVRVTFGSLSCLERIGVGAFGSWRAAIGVAPCGLVEICIPDSVHELCNGCFKGCKSLRRVTFGRSPLLERVGVLCFCGCGLVEFEIPASVREIGGGAFGECEQLELRSINCRRGCRFLAFKGLILSRDCKTCCCSYVVRPSICIPASVRELCENCFKRCKSLGSVTFSSSSLERLGVDWIKGTQVQEVVIPDSVRELCDGCFKGHMHLLCVKFGSSSSLERIGVSCFENTGVGEVFIPDSVYELCDSCFKGCGHLQSVTFGSSSSLERIGVSCFENTGVREVHIPDSVCELCDSCFKGCGYLQSVTFGSLSSLERIGVSCFEFSPVRKVRLPNGVREVGDRCFTSFFK